MTLDDYLREIEERVNASTPFMAMADRATLIRMLRVCIDQRDMGCSVGAGISYDDDIKELNAELLAIAKGER